MPLATEHVHTFMTLRAGAVGSSDNATEPDRATQAPSRASSSLTDDELGLAIGGGLFLLLLIVIVLLGIRRRRRMDKKSHAVSSPVTQEVASPRPSIGPTLSPRYLLDNTSFVSSSISFGSRISCFLQETQDQATDLWHHPIVQRVRLSVRDLALDQLVARGQHSEIYRGYYRHQLVAVKKPLPQWLGYRANLNVVFARVKVLASPSLSHANLVAFLGVSWRSLAYVCLLSEFMGRGDLRAYMKRRRQQGTREGHNEISRRGFCRPKLVMASQLASALSFLHAQGLVHGAVRSRNVLLDEEMNAKLTGYQGSCRRDQMGTTVKDLNVPTSFLPHPVPTTIMAKKHQEGLRLDALSSAPEVLRGEWTNAKTDIFAFGLLLAEMDALTVPYGYNRRDQTQWDSGELLEKIAAGHVHVHFASSRGRHGRRAVSSALVDGRLTAAVVRLGKACVALNAFERPSAAQVSTELHKVLQLYDRPLGSQDRHRTG